MNQLVYGTNSVELDEHVDALRHELDATGLSTTNLDVQATTLADLQVACQSAPFFGGNRLVILRNPIAPAKRGAQEGAGDAEDDTASGRIPWAELSSTLATAAPTTTIILRHDGGLSDNHFLVKFARKLGWTTTHFDIASDGGFPHWVQSRMERAAAELGIRVMGDAPDRLIQRLYPTYGPGLRKWDAFTPDARLIATEIDKLVCGATDGVIDAALVDELVADRSGFLAFQLNERIYEGATEQALQELEHVLEAGEAPQKILASISSELSGFAATHALREYGTPAVAAASAIGESRLSALAKRSAGVSDAALASAAELLRGAEATEKTGKGAGVNEAIVPLVAGVSETIRARRRG